MEKNKQKFKILLKIKDLPIVHKSTVYYIWFKIGYYILKPKYLNKTEN